MSEALFDMAPIAPPPPPEKESADRRRTRRQAEAVQRGVHPLALMFAGVRMHPEADRSAASSDGRYLPYRCGSCRFREVALYHNRSYGKCFWFRGDQPKTADGYPRVSHSAASDVRAWWPACTDYEPGDNQLSPDAARWIPEAEQMPEVTA